MLRHAPRVIYCHQPEFILLVEDVCTGWEVFRLRRVLPSKRWGGIIKTLASK